jgi:hypothetical protein
MASIVSSITFWFFQIFNDSKKFLSHNSFFCWELKQETACWSLIKFTWLNSAKFFKNFNKNINLEWNFKLSQHIQSYKFHLFHLVFWRDIYYDFTIWLIFPFAISYSANGIKNILLTLFSFSHWKQLLLFFNFKSLIFLLSLN